MMTKFFPIFNFEKYSNKILERTVEECFFL